MKDKKVKTMDTLLEKYPTKVSDLVEV